MAIGEFINPDPPACRFRRGLAALIVDEPTVGLAQNQ
jgi:hypothetical protein